MRAMLSPSTLLISGEPKQDAKAISAFPYLATTVSATQSATEFPTANIVRPRMAACMETLSVDYHIALHVKIVFAT